MQYFGINRKKTIDNKHYDQGMPPSSSLPI